jgi:hypothetical protein
VHTGFGFWWGNLSEADHLEDPGIDWRIILKWMFKKWDEGAWVGVDVAQDRDRWPAFVKR